MHVINSTSFHLVSRGSDQPIKSIYMHVVHSSRSFHQVSVILCFSLCNKPLESIGQSCHHTCCTSNIGAVVRVQYIIVFALFADNAMPYVVHNSVSSLGKKEKGAGLVVVVR